MDHVDCIAPISSKDRRVAAVSHLGIPFCGVFLPLLLTVADEGRTPFCKVHVRHALVVQLRFLVVLLVADLLGAVYPNNEITYPAFMMIYAFTLGFEIPNVRRAVAGVPPVRFSLRRLADRPTSRPG